MKLLGGGKQDGHADHPSPLYAVNFRCQVPSMCSCGEIRVDRVIILEQCTESIGAATTAAQEGVADSVIQALGRWTSATFLGYICTPRSN